MMREDVMTEYLHRHAATDMDLAEPTLEEIFADNVTRLLMARDGVRERDLRATLRRVGQARAKGPAPRFSGPMSALETIYAVSVNTGRDARVQKLEA